MASHSYFGRVIHPPYKHRVQDCALCCLDLLIWRAQVPENVRVERQDETGPAGKLQGVHRDFLLLMMYYPYKDGCAASEAQCHCFGLCLCHTQSNQQLMFLQAVDIL